MALCESYAEFDPDAFRQPAVALHVDVPHDEIDLPVHRHRKGQLVLALRGGLICQVPGALWMVPPRCAVWIPGGMAHTNRVTANGRICFLFIEPEAAAMPAHSCTLAITPLVRELILHLTALPEPYDIAGPTGRLVAVLLEELARMPTGGLHLPLPDEPRLRRIANTLSVHPADRSTTGAWARKVAMSERSLTRLVLKETGMSFGRWRQQLHIAVALQHLAAGASVQRTAATLGYESVTAFITMFKKALGEPPARYMAQKESRSRLSLA